MNIKFGVFWKQNLGTIYKDNSITTLGKEADVDLNLSEVSSIHANFKVDGKNYTSIVYIVDIENGLIRIPFTREVLSIGMHELELVAVMKNGDVIPSQTFTYNIVESLDNLEDITEETNYPILIQLLQDVNSKIAEIDDAIARIPSPEELKGEKGDKGEKGEQGIQGERGLQGIQGIRGEKGDKGDRGLQGIQGVKGEKGDKGERGERGLQGIQGNQGARGIQGEKGDKGETGVGLGFEWSGTKLGIKKDTDTSYKYVELKGAKGEQGAKGEKGDTPSITHLEKQVSDKSKELDIKFNTLTAKQQQDAEVVTARDGEVSLHARLERDLEKGKIHFADIEGSSISTESEEGYLENVEIHGNTWQDAENLSDIRSVGTKVEGQELYKIDVISSGKNLFDVNDVVLGKYVSGGGGVGNKIAIDNKNACGYVFIRVKPNTTYIYKSSNIKAYLRCMDTLEIESGLLRHYSTYTILQTLPTTNYLAINVRSEDTATNPLTLEMLANSSIQLEESTQATPYEPYQEHKLTILSPVQLEKVGDVADRIVCKDGVWGVEKNVKKLVLNGKENGWKVTTRYNSETLHFYECKLTDSRTITPICNKYISKGITPYSTEECVFIDTNWDALCFKVSKEKYPTLNSFTESLANLDTVVYYPTTQPTFIPLPNDQQIKLRTFADRTNIRFGTEIEGTIKAQVPKSLGATVNTHTTQIDNLNKELDRVKKLEESTVSTVTSDKAFTTVNETSNGYFEDVKIEGKTLVNLADIHPTFKETCTSWYKDHTLCSTSRLKLNTPYTFIIDCKYLEGHNSNYYYFEFGGGNIVNGYNGSIVTNLNMNMVNMPNSGVYVLRVEFKDFRGYEYLSCRPCRRSSSPVEGEMANYDISVLLLEGDHTDKDISFFEGLKSVGEDSDEISVSSVNTNIIDFNSVARIGTKGVFEVNYKEKTLNLSRVDGNVYEGALFEVYLTQGEHNISLTKNSTKNILYEIFDKNNKSLVRNNVESAPKFSISSNDKYYIGIYPQEINSGVVTISNIEIDNLANDFKQDKKQILYYNPTTQAWEKPVLREWDSIEKHSDGKYYYHKRSGEVVLDGSENWMKGASPYQNTNLEFVIYIEDAKALLISDDILSNYFSFNSLLYAEDSEGITVYTENRLAIKLNKSKLSTQDVQGFKQWLQANPTTVVYQLAKEEVYECTNLDLITYPNETNLIVNCGAIQPRITLKVLSNVSNVVKLLQEKVSILENKFIKGLQQVLAGDMMSLAHLLYPQDFENNHEIQTLEL